MRSVQWLLAGGGPLKEKLLRGGIWLLLSDGIARLANFLKLVILARLLSPTDFGLMGIALVVLRWLEYFTQTGLNSALIQKSGDIRPYLDTAWAVQALRGFALAAIVFISAPLCAWFFGNQEATSVIRAAGVLILLRGFTNPAVVYFTKELDFKREVIWRLSGVGAGLVIGVPLAFVFQNVWALVLSDIATQFVTAVVSYWIISYSPRFRVDWSRARELMQFGKWIFWWSVVSYFDLNLDSFYIAKMLGATTLGFYQLANQIALLPLASIAGYVMKLLFPAFSKQQDKDLRSLFLDALAVVFSVAVPIGCFLTFFAKPLVQLLFGMQWISISPTLQILAWAGVLSAVTGVAIPLLAAVNRPDLLVRTSLLKTLVLAGFLYPLSALFGMLGVALAVTAAAFVTMTYTLYLIIQLVEPTGPEIIAALKVGALGSVPFLTGGLFVPPSPSLGLFLILGLALAGYATVLVTGLRAQFAVRGVFSLSSRL